MLYHLSWLLSFVLAAAAGTDPDAGTKLILTWLPGTRVVVGGNRSVVFADSPAQPLSQCSFPEIESRDQSSHRSIMTPDCPISTVLLFAESRSALPEGVSPAARRVPLGFNPRAHWTELEARASG